VTEEVKTSPGFAVAQPPSPKGRAWGVEGAAPYNTENDANYKKNMQKALDFSVFQC